MFYLYILQSEITGQLYIGQTNNLSDRIVRHNTGRNKWTKGKGPWKLLYTCEYSTRAEAMAMERLLKSWKAPARVIAWIKNQSD